MWSLYSALLIEHSDYEIMILAAQPLGIVDYEGLDLITQKQITPILKQVIHNSINQMVWVA